MPGSLSDRERISYLTTPSIDPLPTDSLADLRMKYHSHLEVWKASITDHEMLDLVADVAVPRGDSLEDYRRAGRYQQLGTPFLEDERTNTDLFNDVLGR